MHQPEYGRGPAPWISPAPRARHQGSTRFQPVSSGSQQNYERSWAGDAEQALPGLGRTEQFVQRNAGNYLLYRAAIAPTEHKLEDINTELHMIEADVHPDVPSLGNPRVKERVGPSAAESDKLPTTAADAKTKRRPAGMDARKLSGSWGGSDDPGKLPQMQPSSDRI